MLQSDFADGEFHAVLDKGTLDAIFTDTNDVTLQKVERMLNEVSRVLRVGGRYVCVSLAQQHILQKVLEFFPPRLVTTTFSAIVSHTSRSDTLLDNYITLSSLYVVDLALILQGLAHAHLLRHATRWR